MRHHDTEVRMTRIGLVLGAGGMTGQAYHAGVLAALAEHTGWDPREARVIVGSSAGSVTGSVLRLGASAPDLAAYASDQPLSDEGAALFALLGERERDFPPFDLSRLARGWRVPSPRLAARTLRRPWALRAAAAAATLLPSGGIDLMEHTTALEQLAPASGWPEGLLVCATRRDDAARVVFGRPGAPTASLAAAVAASCAIPGYFAPVRVGTREYIDGGAHSPTNADVLRASGVDLAVVVSPMSARGGRARTADAVVRLAAHRRLERESARLRAAGIEVLAFEPTGRTLSFMGVNAMAQDRSAAVVQAAAEETARRLADPRVAVRVDHLRRSGPLRLAA
jgi:NTE family protein